MRTGMPQIVEFFISHLSQRLKDYTGNCVALSSLLVAEFALGHSLVSFAIRRCPKIQYAPHIGHRSLRPNDRECHPKAGSICRDLGVFLFYDFGLSVLLCS